MKKIYKSFVAITCLILAFVSIALVGCNNTKVESIKLSQSSLNLVVGNSETLTATITPDEAKDETITWTTSDDKVATVSNGKVTAVAKGEATITAKAGDKEATCKVTVTEAPATVAVTSVTLNKESTSIAVGAKETLTVTVAPDNATNKNVTWKSSDTTIATVSNTGEVTGVKEGKAIITVTSAADTTKTDTCEVTVTAAAPSGTETSFTFLDGATFAVNTSTQTVTLDGVKFANTASLKLAETDNRKVFELSGTAPTFNTSNATGESKSQAAAFGNVAARDSFVVLTFNNPDKKTVTMGWIEKNADGTFNTTLTEGTTPGYKQLTKTSAGVIDTDMILWLNRPNRTNYFYIKVGTDSTATESILDVSKATISNFFMVEDRKVKLDGTAAGTSETGSFENVKSGDKTDLVITKQFGANNVDDKKTATGVEYGVDVYEVTGTAQNFTNNNKTVFTNDNSVDENHRYIVFRVNQPQGEKYKSGWVSTPSEKLTAATYDKTIEKTVGGTIVGSERTLWVTNPAAAGKNYYKIEVENGRSYVLDISKLNTGNNILNAPEGYWDVNGKSTVETDGQGFTNQHALTFTTNGSVTKITGRATQFNPTNAAAYSDASVQKPCGNVTDSTTGGQTNCDAVVDEYIVLGIDDSFIPTDNNNTELVLGWVKTPGTPLCAAPTNGEDHGEGACNANCVGVNKWTITKDNNHRNIIWVTRQGTSGYYFRIEANSNGARRAYVYDLSELVSDANENERVQDFFKVENKEIKVGDYTFQNGAGSDLKIEKVAGQKNVYKIKGKATQFNSTNKNAFKNEVTTESEEGYIVFRMNMKKDAKYEVGWVTSYTDTNLATNTDGHRTLTAWWNEAMAMHVNRDNRASNIWCVKVTDEDTDGNNGSVNYYYLDLTDISTNKDTFCPDCVAEE